MNLARQRKIYILLTRSRTVVSKTIGLLTGDEYTHVAIALDRDLKSLCSFSRHFRRLPLPAGLVEEPLSVEHFGDVPCMLCAVTVTEPVYRNVRRTIHRMMREKERYSYSIKGLAMCRIGIAEKRPGKYFCSQFVSEVLGESGAVKLPKAPPLMRPQDFTGLPELECLYRGEMAGLLDMLEGDDEVAALPSFA
jgi:inositol transport system substrate-binding protein